MGSTEARAQYPATSDEITAALNAALAAGDQDLIMGTMGEMTRAHRMRRVTQETGMGWGSLYKCMRAGASPEFDTMLRVRIASTRCYRQIGRRSPRGKNKQNGEKGVAGNNAGPLPSVFQRGQEPYP